MDNDGARQLARLRANLERATDQQLGAIALGTIDEMIDFLRKAFPGQVFTETAAAVSAELHKRLARGELPTYAPSVGNA